MNSRIEDLNSQQQRALYELCWRYEQELHEGKEVPLQAYAADLPELDSQLVINELEAIARERQEQLCAPNLRPPVPADDRYEMLEEIARGGAAAVWRVRDRHLQRETAVKFLLDSQDNHVMRKRLESEARLCARLVHPGIVPIHELSSFADGRPFVSMKLVKGHTLLQLLEADRPISTTNAIDIFAKVCHAMAYAHSVKIIHRDLKPSNIMVGAFGEVQIMDWGLGKQLDNKLENEPPASHEPIAFSTEQSRDDTQRLVASADTNVDETLSGSVLGTLAYMSPEQASGRIESIDCRSDVFSLGAILCRIFTGAPPYRNTEQVQQLKDAQTSNLQDAFVRLRYAKESKLAQLAIQCLSPNPNSRPRDAQELLSRLEKLLTLRNRRRRVISTLVTMVSIVLLMAVTAFELQRQKPTQQALAATAINVEIPKKLTIENVLSVADARQFAEAHKLYLQFVKSNPTDHYGRFRFGVTLLNSDEFESAERIIQEAIQLAPSTADYHVVLSLTQFWQNRVQDAIDGLEQAKQVIELDSKSQEFLDSKLAHYKSHIKCAELLDRETLEDLLNGKSDQKLDDFATTCELQGRVAEAIQFYDKSIENEPVLVRKNLIRDAACAFFVRRSLKRKSLTTAKRNQLLGAWCRWMQDELTFAMDLNSEQSIDLEVRRKGHQDLLKHIKSTANAYFIQDVLDDKNVDPQIRTEIAGIVREVNEAKIPD